MGRAKCLVVFLAAVAVIACHSRVANNPSADDQHNIGYTNPCGGKLLSKSELENMVVGANEEGYGTSPAHFNVDGSGLYLKSIPEVKNFIYVIYDRGICRRNTETGATIGCNKYGVNNSVVFRIDYSFPPAPNPFVKPLATCSPVRFQK